MSTLYILFGPIASGKSTFAEEMARTGCLIANDDSIVTSLHAGQYGLYDAGLKPLYKGVRNHIIAYAAAIDESVVVDSTALTRERRLGLAALGRSLDMEVCLVVFRRGQFLGNEDGVRRYYADPRGYDEEYWKKVGRVHKQQHDPVVDAERNQYDGVRYVEWK